jgi:hypothetical protein
MYLAVMANNKYLATYLMSAPGLDINYPSTEVSGILPFLSFLQPVVIFMIGEMHRPTLCLFTRVSRDS